MSTNRFAVAGGMVLAAVLTLPAQKKPMADQEVIGHIFRPAALPPPTLTQLHVPTGFRIEKFAEKLGNARLLAVAPDGAVYVTRRPGLHGIAISNGKVYLATVHEVLKGDIKPDGTFGPLEMIIHDLPDAGRHNTRTIAVGPDNMLCISIGSTCNECAEPNPENAAPLRATLDGKSRSIFASGLRDTIGWGWHPQTGDLWGMDHGTDWLGDDARPEELNKIEKGQALCLALPRC